MFINMVPDHRSNQMKPKSGACVGTGFAGGTQNLQYKHGLRGRLRSMNCRRDGTARTALCPVSGAALLLPWIVKQARKKRAHIARRVGVTVDANGTAADREREAVHVGH